MVVSVVCAAGMAGACGSWRRWPPSGGPAGPAAATRAPGLGSRVCGSPYELQARRRMWVLGAWFGGTVQGHAGGEAATSVAAQCLS